MSILILYSLYLYVFGVLAYCVIPGGTDTYDLHFNVGDGMENQAFTLIAALALFRTKACGARRNSLVAPMLVDKKPAS